MFSRRKACCCLTLRQFYFAHACLSLISGVLLVVWMWYRIYDEHKNPDLISSWSTTSIKELALGVFWAMTPMAQIYIGVTGLKGVIRSELGLLWDYTGMCWCGLVLHAIHSFVICASINKSCIDWHAAKPIVEGADPQEYDATGCRTVSIATYITLPILTLVQFYWCLLLLAYTILLTPGVDSRSAGIPDDVEANKDNNLELNPKPPAEAGIEYPIEKE